MVLIVLMFVMVLMNYHYLTFLYTHHYFLIQNLVIHYFPKQNLIIHYLPTEHSPPEALY